MKTFIILAIILFILFIATITCMVCMATSIYTDKDYEDEMQMKYLKEYVSKYKQKGCS